MKAMILSALGGPEVFRLADLPKPAPGPGQLLVHVRAAAVNPIDYKLRQTGALGIKPGDILGFDAAGIVEAIGAGVHDFGLGEEVFYSPGFGLPGAYAEYNVVPANIVARKPANLSLVEAASIPLAGQTAYSALFNRGDLRLGQTILISAINGGVGSLAVQLAKAAGAFVFGTASTRSLPFAQTLGADRVINYQREDFAAIVRQEAPAGLDLVFDCAGGDYVSRSMPLMKPLGRIVTIVNPAGKLDEGYRKNIALHYEFLQRKAATMEILRVLLERRQIRPLMDSILPLTEVAAAHRKLEAGGIRGKIVLEIP